MGLLTEPITWSLVSVDDGTEVKGQFIPTNLTENIGGVWAEQATFGHVQPILQFVRGELETITCDIRIFAAHQGILGLGADDIESAETRTEAGIKAAGVQDIRNLARADSDLGRPHVYVFTVGAQFPLINEDESHLVIVRKVSNIVYDRMRPKDGGSLRGISASLEMARFILFDAADLTGAAESLVVSAQEGDFYEAIAGRVFNDAILGEALRRRNPDRRVLTFGDQVHVPNAVTLRRELELKPQSIALQRDEEGLANFDLVLDLRSAPTKSHLILEEF